ncbi:MAG TPA: hypothetical protein VNS79_03130 [Sphingobium sp.]|nr:hypothetical protein [Sphingobium sp.]
MIPDLTRDAAPPRPGNGRAVARAGRLARDLARAAVAVSALLCAATATAGNPTVLATPVDCDRACLTGVVSAVLDAMVSKDISSLPLANHVRTTQNGVALPLYDGIWQSVSGLGQYRLDAIDPDSGQAGTYATVIEGGRPVYIALRVRVHAQKIDEIEVLAARGGGFAGGTAGEKMEARGQPRPQMLRTVPDAKRMSRETLVAVADAYFAHLQASTGKSSAPFAKSCERLENGTQTTNLKTPRAGREAFDVLMLNCEEQQLSGFYPFVTTIRDRRFPIVDRERGLVMGFGYFDHSGTVGDMLLTNGKTVPSPIKAPLSFMISELFQIDDGKIDQVEAVIDTVPYKMRSDIWDRPE